MKKSFISVNGRGSEKKLRVFLIALRLVFAAVLFFLVSCVTFPNFSGSQLPEELPVYEQVGWKYAGDGIQRYDYKKFKMDYHVIRIDLSRNWKVVSYPQDEGWIKPMSVSVFAKRNGCDVAINTNPFLFTSRVIWWSKIKPIGICRTDYKDVSSVHPSFCALAFYEENGSLRAEIEDSQKELIKKNPVHAYGGFHTVLRNGVIKEFERINDVRSAAGIADEGKTLYLLVGKNLSYMDTAEIFRSLGCDSAMEFDGGSSSQMSLYGKPVFFNFPPRNISAIMGLKRG